MRHVPVLLRGAIGSGGALAGTAGPRSEARGRLRAREAAKTQCDTCDKAVPDDLKQASAVTAVTAWELASLGELLPRGPTSPPERIPTEPSASVAGK